jgi:hypothetical protein
MSNLLGAQFADPQDERAARDMILMMDCRLLGAVSSGYSILNNIELIYRNPNCLDQEL